MAEEKKPKIDLKARLGKSAGGGVPAATGSVPAPPTSSMAPGPGPGSDFALGGGVPVPPGVPLSSPSAFGKPTLGGLDPSNPLAAVAAPYRDRERAPVAQAHVLPQAQRIEIDEQAIADARKGAHKRGLTAGLLAAVIFGAVGYGMGSALEAQRGRQKAVGDAKSLAVDVAKSSEQLKLIAEKVESGRSSLLKDKKFPDSLARELGAINVDFEGSKLAGIRFSGFSQETTSTLIEYVTQVHAVNDRKAAVIGLLQRLQKPISEQLASGQKTNISYAVFLGRQDPSKNNFAMLAPLQKPIEATSAAAISLPAEFAAIDPLTHQNISAPKYSGGGLDKPSAVYVLPRSIEAACPSETSGSIAQLGSQLGRLIIDIKGEQAAPGGDVVTESKPGLMDRAEKLVSSLNRVQ